MRLLSKLATGLFAGGLLFATPVVGEAATTCVKTIGSFCSSVTSVSLYTGTPTIICPIGDDVVEVQSSAQCFGLSAGPVSALRCSSLSTGLFYSGGSFVHNVAPVPGADWGDVLSGDCTSLAYRVFLQQ